MTPFDRGYYSAFYEKYGVRNERKYANNIHYTFVYMTTGEVAIFEYDAGHNYPIVIACDKNKVLSYINLTERVNVPIHVIA